MSRTDDDQITDGERVSPAYSHLLREVVRASGIKRKDLLGPKGTGRSSTVLWRVLGHNEAPSFGAAARVRARILELAPQLESALPPPSVAVESAAHYAWLRIGTELLGEDSDGFDRLLERVTRIYDAMVAERTALDDLAAMHGGSRATSTRASGIARPRLVTTSGQKSSPAGRKSSESKTPFTDDD